MMAEIVPSPPPRRSNPHRWLVRLALAAIVIFGARLRLEWPQVPLSDPDVWGYLNPGLSKLLGEGFQHTFGRNFVYPAWLYLLLRCFGTFRAICIGQHILGLGTGVILWKIWERWREWFSSPRLPAWIVTPLGLGLAAFYVSSTMVIYFEQQIRPEAIFPFFSILGVYLAMEFLRAWFKTGRMLLAAALAGAVVFEAVLAYELKPSFGLAAGVAMLPLLAAAVRPGAGGRRLLLGAGAAGGALLAFLLLLWPEHELSKPDETSTLFLPETLLTVHADAIRDQMAQDLANGNLTPYPTPWLTSLRDRLNYELALASQPDQRPYGSLGFNPDYLLYKNSFCRFLLDEMSPQSVARLCFYYYRRAWLHRPEAMASNVARQLGIFYSADCPAFWRGRSIDIARVYRKTLTVFNKKDVFRYPPALACLMQSQRLADVPAIYREQTPVTVANILAAEGHLPLLIAVGAGFAILLIAPSAAARRELGPPGWLVLLFSAYTFGNCLTVAIVHSFDVDRYSTNLLVFAILAEVTALTWCVEALLCARFRLNPDLYPPAPLPRSDASTD